jgi:hypothetical protein
MEACKLGSQWHMLSKWATNIWENVRKLEEHLNLWWWWKNANSTDHFKSDRLIFINTKKTTY